MGAAGVKADAKKAAYAPWLELRVDGDVAFMKRTRVPFDGVDQARGAYTAFIEVLEASPATRLLTDLREAPGRNDPDFERMFAPLRARMFAAFERRALVVASTIGKLHVERHAKQDGFEVRVFLDAGAAATWLRTP